MNRAVLLLCFLLISVVAISQVPDTSEIQEVEIASKAFGTSKQQTPYQVNVIDANLIKRTLATNFCEVLAFSGGLRTETDCQTCNYTQLRMNGLGGAYTQILINGRPLFSSLMGLYGLEQIPSNSIEQVEIVRGGGSVAYGANAIAGTVNVITKAPTKTNFAIQQTFSLVGMKAQDWNAQLNGAFVNKKKTSALSLFAALKKRQALDVNGDGFSEIPLVNGNSLGLTYDQKLFKQFNFQFNTFLLNEERRGGNKFHLSPEQTDQCEFRDQLTTMNQGSLQWNGKKLSVQLFSGFQSTQRKHYTGVNQVDGWGTTSNHTVQTGLQVNYKHPFFNGNMWWLLGGEHLLDDVLDRVDAYQYLIDQRIDQKAVYLQNQWEISEKWTVLGGIRLNKHSRVEAMYVTPRLALLFKPTNRLQMRINYGKGVKAAQVLETDMHMAFANGGVSTVQTDSQLKSESSNALTATVDWNKRFAAFAFSLTGNAFYTELRNPFVLEEIGQDSLGNTTLFRTNGSTAKVKGVSLEVKILWSKFLQMDAGFTVQQANYASHQIWSNSVQPSNQFLRTPNDYGFLSAGLFPKSKTTGGINVVYTGSMLVPHFGGAPENSMDQLHVSKAFVDCSIRLQHRFHIHRYEQNIIIGLALQNVFNAYQQDFDTTQNRDSNYIYGPSKPRTFQVSLRYEIGAE